MDLSDLQQRSGNWREQIRKNSRKTRMVILIFVSIYLAVGLLVDTVGYLQIYPYADYSTVMLALVSFRITPYATLILGAIAAVSLLVTYTMYDKIMLMGTEYREITPQTARGFGEKQLYNIIEELKISAGMRYTPKVYIIQADYMNAFASGYSEKSAMVAITKGLLEKLNRAEVQAVMAHELSHIRHQDIKLTLTTAVLSNIMLIVIDMLFYTVLYGRNSRRDNRLFIVIMILRYVLPLLTVMLTLFLSRTREYMADAGSVQLTRDNEPMASALIKIHQDYQNHAGDYHADVDGTAHEELRRASYIYDPKAFGFTAHAVSSAFSTHPALADRLKALGYVKKPER